MSNVNRRMRRAAFIVSAVALVSVIVPSAAAAAPTTLVDSAIVAASSESTPRIGGTSKVGNVLTAAAGTWRPAPTSVAYRWLRNGTDIKGASARTYTVQPADAGQRLSVAVTVRRPGYATVRSVSAARVVPLQEFHKAPTPRISGSAKSGQTLAAAAGSWSPSGTRLTYQWRRDGRVIGGATQSTYRLTATDAGKTITVSVTGTKRGFRTLTRTSAGLTIAVDPSVWARQTWGTFTPRTISGVGDKVVALPAGARSGILTAKSTGSRGVFFVDVLDSRNQVVDSPIIELSPYSGVSPFGLTAWDRGTKLQVEAEGPWTITVQPVHSAPLLARGKAVSGTSSKVFLYGGPPTTASGRFTSTDGYGLFFVDQYFSASDRDSPFIEGGRSYSGSVAVQGGPSLVVVDTSDASWRLAF